MWGSSRVPLRTRRATMCTPSPVARWRPSISAIGFSTIFIGRMPSAPDHITYFGNCRNRQGIVKEAEMNSPSRVINFVNAAHFIDHYAMLIFAAAVIIMGPALGMAYSELLPYATPGFVAFGAGSL